MTSNKNFRWLAVDIDHTLVLKVLSKKNGIEKECGIFNIIDVLDTVGDKLEVETANIDDLSNLLSLGIVRFEKITDNNDILDIPFRNLYKLYQNANVLDEDKKGRLISFRELDIFSVIDDDLNIDDLYIYASVINKISDDLDEVMKIAFNFIDYSMNEKFKAMERITEINHRRLINELK